MKKCQYCGHQQEDNLLTCNSCGASEFNNICNNCDTTFDSNCCPTCGLKAGEQPKHCNKCGFESIDLYCPRCGTLLKEKHIEASIPETKKQINSTIKVEKCIDTTVIIPTVKVMSKVPVNKPILTPLTHEKTTNHRDYRALKIFLVFLTPFAILFWVFTILDAVTIDDVPAPISTIESPKPQNVLPKPTPVIVNDPYETSLTAGNYICGDDIPIGTFIFSSDCEIGTVYIYYKGEPIEYIPFDELTPEHKIVLKKGYIVSVCDQIEVNIKSIELNSYEIKPRRINSNQSFQLKEGTYIAGKDFDAGIYNIKAISGDGYVNSTGIHYNGEYMSNEDEVAIKEYKNAILDEGTELRTGLTIKLIPVD